VTADSDKRDSGPEARVYRSGHERRMLELEEELEVARKQAEIERARAEAVTQHLVTENQQIRQRTVASAGRPSQYRANPNWRLVGHLIGRLGSAILGLISCLTFVVMVLLIWAYWPELSSMLGLNRLP
jgi:hypothetical protein